MKIRGGYSKIVIELRQLVIIALSLTLTSCASYRSSFNCGDAKGIYCASMDVVDQMIESGEIARFNERRKGGKKYKMDKTHIPNIVNSEVLNAKN